MELASGQAEEFGFISKGHAEKDWGAILVIMIAEDYGWGEEKKSPLRVHLEAKGGLLEEILLFAF